MRHAITAPHLEYYPYRHDMSKIS